MTAFIAFWPDSTISILSYPSGYEEETYESWLFDDLDAECDPLDAKVYKLPPGYHVQTEAWIGEHKKTGESKALISVTSFHLDGKRPRRLEWSPDAQFKRLNRVRMQQRRKAAEQASLDAVQIHQPSDSAYPPVPAAVFTVDEVRAMEPFAGIYVAVNETTGAVQYVGKSKNVTGRVSGSRPELRDCRIGIVKMAESDIHFAELHYIAKCRPTHNQEGRASRKDATDG